MPATHLPDADVRELAQLVGLVMHRLSRDRREVPDALREAFKRGSLGPRHMRVLISLARRGPASVGELAGRLELAHPTVSLLVNELSRTGLVERHEDERDRRRTIVSVPAAERRRLVRFTDARLDLMRRTLERLEPQAREHFVQGLRVLADEAGGERRPRR